MMEVKIVDNFLPKKELDELKYLIEESGEFPFYFQSIVAAQKGVTTTDKERLDIRKQYCNSYQIHALYRDGQPCSEYCEPICDMFIPRFKGLQSLLRVKVNFYPPTEKVITYTPHIDYDYEHKGALFSLNTCDGFTGLEDGTKVDSIENRILFFNPQTPHSASSTTSPKGRFNINVNYL